MKKLTVLTVVTAAALCLLGAMSVPASAQAPGTAAIAQAATEGKADLVSQLLAQGTDPNVRTTRGRTALMLAARAGHYETVRRLLIAGAQKALKDDDGKTALDMAIENKRGDLIALLQDAS